MSDMQGPMNDSAWAKVEPGTFVYNARFVSGWSDYRGAGGGFFGLNLDHTQQNQMCIKCIGPGKWPVYVRGAYIGDAESWDEAKSLAILIYNVEETS